MDDWQQQQAELRQQQEQLLRERERQQQRQSRIGAIDRKSTVKSGCVPRMSMRTDTETQWWFSRWRQRWGAVEALSVRADNGELDH